LIVPNIVILCFASELIELWLGSGFDNVIIILPIIFFGRSIYHLSEPLYKIIQGIGYPKASALVQCVSLLCLIFFTHVLNPIFGFKSVGYSIFAAAIFFTFANALIFWRIVNYKKANS
jgi:O-antigen/teichoic acid export membrane protein